MGKGNPNRASNGKFTTGSSYKKEKNKMNKDLADQKPDIDTSQDKNIKKVIDKALRNKGQITKVNKLKKVKNSLKKYK
jgi:hypothetical protein